MVRHAANLSTCPVPALPHLVADGVPRQLHDRARRHQRGDPACVPAFGSALAPLAGHPRSPPLWASILDDVWALYTDDDDEANREATEWLHQVDDEWAKIGVKTHPSKSVGQGIDCEVQGGRVHTLTHRVGLSKEKCADLMIGVWWLLTQWKPARRGIERVVGKLGHCHAFRPSLHGSFGTIYRWLHGLREGRIGRSALPAVCWWELMEASLLAPLAQMELSAPWAPTVQCTDAAPGGHGLAYAQALVREIQRWVRYCSFRGDYTTLKEDGELYPGPDRCHLVVANLLLKGYHWHEVSRPGGFRHISEEEFAASNWGLERRLHSPGHFGTRCLESGDNTTAVGAAVRGRSSSCALHKHCRRRVATAISGSLTDFRFYMRSALNPADRPSHVREHGQRVPRVLRLRVAIFLHLFSGPRRSSDFEQCIQESAAKLNVSVHVISLHNVISQRHDLLRDDLFSQLRQWCWSGVVFGLLAGHPCCTVSRARHRPGGPPPLYSREHLYG